MQEGAYTPDRLRPLVLFISLPIRFHTDADAIQLPGLGLPIQGVESRRTVGVGGVYWAIGPS